jgi:hypothetical protein
VNSMVIVGYRPALVGEGADVDGGLFAGTDTRTILVVGAIVD